MTEQSTSPAQDHGELSQTASGKYKPIQSFLLGVFFGCIPVWVGLDMSSYMTHTPWLDYDLWKLMLAAGFPVFSGILGVVFSGKFLKALGDVLSSTVI